MTDPQTIALYDARATDYAQRFASAAPDPRLVRFISEMPAEARVLDLGCGPGRAAARIAKAGLQVDAVDASEEMVALTAQHRGVSARVATFDALDAVALYDGVWANFSLLHAPRSAMPSHLAAIQTALKPGGWFSIGLKLGSGEQRDSLGRFYTYYHDAEISGLMEAAGFVIDSREFGAEKGLDGVLAPWITLLAQRGS